MLENKLFIFQRFTNSKEANIFSNDVIPFENYPTFKKYKYHTRIAFDQQQFQILNNVLKEEHNLQLLAENINDIIIHFENLQEKGLIHGNLTKLENIIISTRKCENKVHFVNYKFQNQSPNTNDEKDLIVLLEKPLQILKIQDYSSLFQIKSLLQASINQFGIGRGVLQNIWTFSTNLIWKTHKQHEQVDQELQVFKIDLLNSFLYIKQFFIYLERIFQKQKTQQ